MCKCNQTTQTSTDIKVNAGTGDMNNLYCPYCQPRCPNCGRPYQQYPIYPSPIYPPYIVWY